MRVRFDRGRIQRGAVGLGIGLLGLVLASSAGAGDASSYGAGFDPRAMGGPQYLYGDDERVRITVNVWGEVSRPGSYLVPDDTDLITLLSLAGGPTDRADLRDVRIVRFHPADAGSQVIDLEEAMELPDPAAPALLPGDTIRIPRRASANWGGVLRSFYQVALAASTVILIVDRVNE